MLYPKLRPMETQWVELDGQRMLVLRDRLGLAERPTVAPLGLALLLGLCDGSRDLTALRAAFELRTGVPLTHSQLENLIADLDEALVFDSPRLARARAEALAAFRSLPARAPVLAGRAYPSEASELSSSLDTCWQAAFPDGKGVEETRALRGLVTPHIDFQRGGPVYARTWERARETVAQSDLVILLGIDHAGLPGRITLTRQNYASPLGVLTTAQEIVTEMAEAMGEDVAFGEELHHRGEHSIELAAVWLQYVLDGRRCEMVPILCGSFQPFVEGDDPENALHFAAALNVLRRVISERRTLVVAAADLAHVGPAFGDAHALGELDRSVLARIDGELLDNVASGDARGLLSAVRRERDRWRICGLPAIYCALRVLGEASGEVIDYAQCPADSSGASWVTVGGVMLW